MIIQLGYAFAITMQIAVYYDVVYCTLHYDVIRPNFACALITGHMHILNLLKHTYIFTLYLIRNTMKSFRAKFAKTASIKSTTSTRSFVRDRSVSASEGVTASG